MGGSEGKGRLGWEATRQLELIGLSENVASLCTHDALKTGAPAQVSKLHAPEALAVRP